jgi:hypothetical protein
MPAAPDRRARAPAPPRKRPVSKARPSQPTGRMTLPARIYSSQRATSSVRTWNYALPGDSSVRPEILPPADNRHAAVRARSQHRPCPRDCATRCNGMSHNPWPANNAVLARMDSGSSTVAAPALAIGATHVVSACAVRSAECRVVLRLRVTLGDRRQAHCLPQRRGQRLPRPSRNLRLSTTLRSRARLRLSGEISLRASAAPSNAEHVSRRLGHRPRARQRHARGDEEDDD